MFVGCTGLPAKRGGYYSNLNAVEVVPDQGVPPKPSTARRWAEEAPDGFCFTMVASKFLTTKPEQLPPGLSGKPSSYGGLQLTSEVLELYERTCESALALGARVLLFSTPPQIGPSRRGRETLSRFFERIDRKGMKVAWEPHGPWEDEELFALCRDLELLRCGDPLRDVLPAGPAAYARLGPFVAMGRSMADDELEAIVEILEDFEEAYCFFGTDRAFSDAKRLRATFE